MPPMDEPPVLKGDQLQDQLMTDRYLSDDGFTARTLQRLPGPRRAWRPWVLGTAALLSVLIAVLLSADVVALVGQLLAVWRATATVAVSSGGWSLLTAAIAIAVAATLVLLRDEAW
jgi:hypothetical protein